MRANFAVVSAIFGLAVAGAARAEPHETSSVVVYPFAALTPDVKKVADQATGLLVKEIGNNDAWTVLPAPAEGAPAPAARPGKRDPRAEKALAEARAQARKGASYAARLRFADAGRAYESALKAYDQGGAQLTDLGELWDAAIKAAEMGFRQGREGDAQKAFEVAVRVDPGRALPSGYPPVFTRTYQQVKRRLLGQPRGAIHVAGAPGAAVWLDGKEVGKAPLTLKDVVKGGHFVRVASGSAVFAARVEVPPGGDPVAVDPGLGEAPASAGAGGLMAALMANDLAAAKNGARALASRANADYVVFGAAYRSDDNILFADWLYSASRDTAAPLPEMSMDDDLLGGGIEVGKLADGLQKTASSWPANPYNGRYVAPKAKRGGPVASAENAVSVAPPPPPPALDQPVTKHPVVASAGGSDLPPPPPSLDAAGARPKPVGRQVAKAPPPDDLAVSAPPDRAVAKPAAKKPVDLAAAEPNPGFRSMRAYAEPGSEPREKPEAKGEGGGKWWVWALVGAVAVGAAGGGGYWYYASQKPAQTGTATVTW